MLRLLRLIALPIALLIAAPVASAVVGVRESDGSPDNYVYQLIVTDGTLTDNGDGTASLNIPAPGGGEANTASNLGGGLANFSGKSAVDLQFNSFAAADFDLATNLISIDAAYNAPTATALAANGSNCAAGEIALGVDASGAVEGCYEPAQADISDLDHLATSITDGLIVEADLNATNVPGVGEDNYVLSYNHAGTNFTWVPDAGGAEVNDLSSVVTWANVPDANITESSVTQHEAAIETSIDTLANLTSVQGLTVTLADAAADAIWGWDDTASAYENLTAAEVLAIVGGAANDFDANGDILSNTHDTAAELDALYEGELNNEAGLETAVSGANVIVSTEIDAFSELQTLVADETLLKAGTLTDTKYCIYDSASTDIICNSTPSGSGDLLADGTVPMTADFNYDGNNMDNGGVIFLKEQAEADADVAGSGQIWVNTATPNELWFTDDAGTDTQLGVGGGSGATTDGGDVTYVTSATDDFAAGGTDSTAPLFFDEGLEELKIGSGSTGAIDFGVNTLDDTGVGNILKDWMELKPQSAKIAGSFITTGASIDGGSGFWRLTFVAANDSQAFWQFRMPNSYDNGLVMKIGYVMDSAASGTVDFEVQVVAITDGTAGVIDSETFGTANVITGATTAPATAEYLDEISISLTNDDSVAAGDLVGILLNRDVDDTHTGGADVVYVQLEWNIQ